MACWRGLMVSCPEAPDGPDKAGQRIVRDIIQPRHDPQTAFRDQFAGLVRASGLSIRDIAQKTQVPKSTIEGWKNGNSLPQHHGHLVNVVQVLRAAAGDSTNAQQAARMWTALLREAKETRDARSTRRSVGGASRDPEIEAERRARSTTAAASAKKAFMNLRNLDSKPDWRRERASYSGKDIPELTAEEEAAVVAWEQRRDGLLTEIELAILDIGDGLLRARLTEAVKMVQLWNGPMQARRQSERRTRWIAATDAMEALGAYGRGDPPPDPSASYRNTAEFVEVYREGLEMNDGY
jgi:hypothetical protein